MDRRRFLKTASAVAAAEVLITSLPSGAFSTQRRTISNGLSILQGITTSTSTRLTVDVPLALTVEYLIIDRDTLKEFTPSWVRSATNAKSEFRVDKIGFEGLELGHRYRLLVINQSTNTILDERFLTTVDLDRVDAKIAVMSCMKYSKSAGAKMWPVAMAAQADYYFFIGDAIYGDSFFSHGPDKLWSRAIETRSILGYYHWKNLKPVVAVWDDHDYGKNNEDGNYKHKDATLAVFKSFFAQEDVNGIFLNGPGNSSYFKAFNQNFLFMDCRYFRKLKYRNIKGFFGEDQINWASHLVGNVRDPIWVLQGSPFFGRKEKSSTSYEATSPEELNLFLREIARWNAPAMLFAGDVHYSEISRLNKNILGYESYELISSCMHSSTKSSFYSNPNPRVNGYLKENFLLLEKTGLVSDPTWKVSCWNDQNRVQFNQVIHLG